MYKYISFLVISSLTSLSCLAEWPTYRADNRRSGVTEQALTSSLKKIWSHQGGTPQQAWTGPSKWDSYTQNAGLQSMRNFDPCYYTTISDGKVYYGSSADNAVHCIDLSTGKELWKFFTNSAVRMPPSIDKGKVYFGSDDGFAYAVDASSGKLVWKHSAAPTNRIIYNNGKTISTHPVRTGVTLVNGQAIFSGSLLPWQKSYLVSVDAATGKQKFTMNPEGIQRRPNGYNQNATGATLQGAMLTDGVTIYIPQGRAPALKFDLKTGKSLGVMNHAGGVFCILTENNQFIAGPAHQRNNSDQVGITDASGKNIAAFNNTNRVVTHKGKAYLHTGSVLKGLDYDKFTKLSAEKLEISAQAQQAKKQIKGTAEEKAAAKARVDELNNKARALNSQIDSCWKWETKTVPPSELIISGDKLICGFDGKVEMFNIADGKSVWRTSVEGVVHGLSVSNGHLVISTSLGEIITYK